MDSSNLLITQNNIQQLTPYDIISSAQNGLVTSQSLASEIDQLKAWTINQINSDPVEVTQIDTTGATSNSALFYMPGGSNWSA